MSEENQYSKYNEDEIDLRKLFQSIGQWFINIWFWILGIIIGFRNLTVQFKYLVLSAIILAVGYSFVITTSSDPYYQGSFIVESKYLNNKVAQNISDNLNNLTPLELADTLDLDTAITNQILGFSSSEIKTEEERIELERIRDKLSLSNFDAAYRNQVEELITSQINSYEFIINTRSSSDLKEIIRATSNYCREFNYVKKRIDVNRDLLELKKQKLASEAKKLDSLKTFIVKNIESMGDRAREGSNNVILADDVNANPLNVFEQDLLFYDLILSINKQLALQEDFQVFEGSYEITQPASPSFFDNLKVWLIYALAGAYGIIFLIQINKYLNKVEKDQMNKE